MQLESSLLTEIHINGILSLYTTLGGDMGAEWVEQNVVLLAFILVWDLVWKGIALWKAARNGKTVWFVAMLIINSAGILPILYLLLVDDKRKQKRLKS